MIFNNIINHLKLWCKNKAEDYYKAYGNYGGVTYVGYLDAYEMEFKLSTLIDKPFENTEDLKRAVLAFIDVHYEPSLLNPQNRLAKHIIEKTNREFCDYFEELLSQKDSLALADIPYTRVIVGPETAALQDRFRSVWGYGNTSYWFPLMGDEPKEISHSLTFLFV